MQNSIAKILDRISYWLIILLPLGMAIAPAPMNVFMGLLIGSFFFKKILRRKLPLTSTVLNIPLLLFFAITCVSLINSVDLRDSYVGGILRLLQYIFIFFAVSEGIKDTKHIKIIIASVALGTFIVSMDALWQVQTGADFIRGYLPVINIGLVRATASFKDSNVFGIYLSALAPLIFGLTIFFYRGRYRVLFIIISMVLLIAIALTYSRPTLLAIYAVFLFFGLCKRSKIILSIIIVLTLLSPFIAPGAVKEFAKEVNYNPIRFMCNDDRIAIYLNSLNMIRAHPFIGVGANAFMKSYKYYKDFPEYRNIVTLDEMKAHSIYLHIAGEVGLVGLLIFIWLIFRLFSAAKNIYRSTDDDFLKVIALSLTACLIAFLVNGLTESSLSYSRVSLIFWYLCGFLFAIRRLQEPS